MRSLRTRVEALERAVEAATAGETIVPVVLVVVHSRAEAQALAEYEQAHPAPPHPPIRGRLRLEVGESIDAAELLRQRGVVLPDETTEGKDSDNASNP